MDLIYSEEWKKKNADAKDLKYTPLVKNLQEAMYFPKTDKNQKELLIKVITNKINGIK